MPMPRVIKIVPGLYQDPRLFKLAKKSASYAEALGKVTHFLSVAASYYAVEDHIPKSVFEALGYPELVECGFAQKIGNHYRAKGDGEHFAWLRSQIVNGAKGGKAKAKAKKEASDATAMLQRCSSDALANPGLNEELIITAAPASPTQLVDRQAVDLCGVNPRIKQLVAIWNLNSGNLPKLKGPLSKARAGAARARLAECSDLNEWTECVKALASWPFGLGDNDRGWKANFDYLCRARTLDKFRDGAFCPKPGKQKNQLSDEYFASLETSDANE